MDSKLWAVRALFGVDGVDPATVFAVEQLGLSPGIPVDGYRRGVGFIVPIEGKP